MLRYIQVQHSVSITDNELDINLINKLRPIDEYICQWTGSS